MMSEVMRWKLKGFIPGVEGESKAVFQPVVVLAEDYDNATRLFLDAAERCLAAERREQALQLSLNEADQRIDELTGTTSRAASDIIAERQRQITAEGYKPDRDDCYSFGELALAAAGYAASAGGARSIGRQLFHWDHVHWKPSTPRRDLVKSGALILAEIERIDRAAITNFPL